MEFIKEGDTRRFVRWGLAVIIILAVFLGVKTIGALKDLGENDPVFNSVSVVGDGEVFVIPDIATFSFGVSVDAKTVSEAQSQVTEKTNSLIEKLESAGIEKKDIKTTNYSVWPKYTYERVVCTPGYCPPSNPVPDGYTTSHTITLKIRDTEQAGEILALVGDNGATDISNISFTTDDPDQAVNEARAEAIADAKAKAKLLSKDLGVRLVRVVNFFDSSSPSQPIPYGMGEVAMMKAADSVAPTIPTGENRVRVSVTVVYEIR